MSEILMVVVSLTSRGEDIDEQYKTYVTERLAELLPKSTRKVSVKAAPTHVGAYGPLTKADESAADVVAAHDLVKQAGLAVTGGYVRDDEVSAHLTELCEVTWWEEFSKR